ncbi:hypothetical protein I79_000056 [Cricetulus griseus]|uniref:Uncharacterized protein n=1 Tax=Cricetulus griseus TaxID=10029 RepID=G3GRB3_CRIGR|nr:hypothetical protein I79_000056 [Cricetulus griseus]
MVRQEAKGTGDHHCLCGPATALAPHKQENPRGFQPPNSKFLRTLVVSCNLHLENCVFHSLGQEPKWIFYIEA